jgi:hypothetical protein
MQQKQFELQYLLIKTLRNLSKTTDDESIDNI